MACEILTEGIVLRRWYTGEYDKWISLLTPEHGKLRVRVRGARKPKSKMGMLTEPLTQLEARVIEGKAQRLLAQPQLKRSYLNLRNDLERLSIALALCETLDRWLPEEELEPDAYGVLLFALEALEAGVEAEAVAAWALWRWLALLGYCPDTERCGGCGKELLSADTACRAEVAHDASVQLLPVEGVFRCPSCTRSREGVALTRQELETLQKWTQGASLSLNSRPEVYERLMRAAMRYAECVLESPVRWLEFRERLSALRESG
ncbi:MAG: hypothetical protein KatS3mg017_0569 [Fimbriimonadales bacterium]|nr:MAG: hypothetical protein KatS3mg017_0569 [Fimbriimonadales bacterium]